MKYLAAILALSTVPAMAAPIDGYISDAMCGAKHNGSAPNEACVKKCIGGGSKPVFVDDATKTVYTIDDPDAVKGHEGHHVAVTGKVDDSSKSIHVAKLSMLKDQGAAASTTEH
jgi:hypothetical protein